MSTSYYDAVHRKEEMHKEKVLGTWNIFFFFFNVYLVRDREREQRRGRERVRERIPSRLHTASAEPDTGLEPTRL